MGKTTSKLARYAKEGITLEEGTTVSKKVVKAPKKAAPKTKAKSKIKKK